MPTLTTDTPRRRKRTVPDGKAAFIFHLPTEKLDAARQAARDEGTSVADVVRRAIDAYLYRPTP